LLRFLKCPACSGRLTFMSMEAPGLEHKGKYVILDNHSANQETIQFSRYLVEMKVNAEFSYPGEEDEFRQGLLACGDCGRWYPLENYIPELLPDHLRDWRRDLVWLQDHETRIGSDLRQRLQSCSEAFMNDLSDIQDTGSHYKNSEIHIDKKVDGADFFGPGYYSPFYFYDVDFTLHQLRRFANVAPLLELQKGHVVLDMGVGYAWTTEWLMKIGVEPIGIDICRTYMDVGIKRMGAKRPHLVVGDVEFLPIRDQAVDAVLCYDAFHHVPDRKKAMACFFAALKPMGKVVLAEPNGRHEHAEISKQVMKKYGILEKGMELEDIRNYCEDLGPTEAEQHFILKVTSHELGATVTQDFIESLNFVDESLYRVWKGKPVHAKTAGKVPVGRGKRWVKRMLSRLGAGR